MIHKLPRFFIPLILVLTMLLSACSSRNQPAASASPPIPTASASDTFLPLSPSPAATYTVKTDYSKLTPYQPPEDIYTRLSEDCMPELVPSKDYGPLLPYVGERLPGTFLGDVGVYGLVTAGGMMVTDAVYAGIDRARLYNNDASWTSKPAYMLRKIAEVAGMGSGTRNVLCAACATDGSWVTAFDYERVIFCDEVILLVRNSEKNDIDVINYRGSPLYRFKTLDCYNTLGYKGDLYEDMGYRTISSFGEGYIVACLKNGTVAYIAERTGKTVYSDYSASSAFSDGMACVCKDGLWGYINTDFKAVIKPQYPSAALFRYGQASVQLDGDTFAIIDTRGNVLYSVDGKFVNKLGTDLFEVSYGSERTYLDSDFKPLALKADTVSLMSIPGGWYYYYYKDSYKDGVVLFRGSEEHFIPGAETINRVYGDLVVYLTAVDWTQPGDERKLIVATLDGEKTILQAKPTEVAFAETAGGTIIVLNSYYPNEFTLYDITGKQLSAGQGTVVYDRDSGLFAIDAETSFSFADAYGTAVFRLSLLEYLPD